MSLEASEDQRAQTEWTLTALAAHLSGTLDADRPDQDELKLTHLVALDVNASSPQGVALCLSRRYIDQIGDSSAALGAIVTSLSLSTAVREQLDAHRREVSGLILIEEHITTQEVTSKLLRSFNPPRSTATQPLMGVHPTAQIHPTAQVHPSARVGAFAVLEADVNVGALAEVGAFCYLGAHVTLGVHARLAPRVTLLGGTVVLPDAVIHSGAVIGSPGFGLDAQGQLPHHGSVQIGRGARVGALTCVDQATLGVTRIGHGAQLDNLIQVGHNVQVGAGSVLCAQVGLAGGASLGDGVTLGGQVGVTQRAHIGARASVGAKSGVTKSLPPNERYSGYPAERHRLRLKREARLKAWAERIGSSGALIHPSAQVDSSAHIGEGVVIGPHCVIEAECRLEPYVTLGAGVNIGAYSVISAHVVISAGVMIGEAALIRARAAVFNDVPPFLRYDESGTPLGLHYTALKLRGMSARKCWAIRAAYKALTKREQQSEEALYELLSVSLDEEVLTQS